MVGAILGAVADVVWPPLCHLCRAPLDAGVSQLCTACRLTLAEECDSDGCPRCGEMAAPWEVFHEQCATCRQRGTPLLGTVRVGPYRGVLGRLVRLVKYDGREELVPLLARWLAGAIEAAPWLSRVEAVATVPSHWRRRITAPFYTADALATTIADRFDWPVVSLLKRRRAGRRQVGLSYSARQENVRGAFVMRGGATLNGARVLLVDDVKTTGATLDECARMLKKSGASEVYASVVAKVDWQHQAGGAITVA